MDQIQADGICLTQNTGDNEEISIIEDQSNDNQSIQSIENQQILPDDVSVSPRVQNIESDAYTAADNLIQESETLCEDLALQNAIQEQLSTNQEPSYNESSAVIETVESAEHENPIDIVPTETVSNNSQKEDAVTANEQELITESSAQQSNVEQLDENPAQTNSLDQIPQTPEKKIIPKEVFIDLDIPKPDLSSTSDEEIVTERSPPVSSDDDDVIGPVDLETVLQQSSLDETSQDQILNQSSQRITAPQQFIPSSQLVMTKQALQEGNSFLRSILNKLKSMNQFLKEKTSKILTT